MEKAEFHKVVLIMVIVLAVVSTVFILIKYQKEPQVSEEKINELDVILPDETSLALLDCSQKTGTEKSNCYLDIAVKNKNATFCYVDKENEEIVPQCMTSFVSSIAATKDVKACNNDAFCIVTLAKISKDSKICENLSGEEAIVACKNEI